MKITRKLMAHFINTATTGTAAYERLGKDLTEYNAEMNANVEKNANILGEVSVEIDSYQPQASVTPYYAEDDTKLSKYLQNIIDNRLTGDDLKTDIVEVHMWEPTSATEGATTFKAFKEIAMIEISSYGGDTKGYQIPFNIHYTGERVAGTFDVKTNTFTAAS